MVDSSNETARDDATSKPSPLWRYGVLLLATLFAHLSWTVARWDGPFSWHSNSDWALFVGFFVGLGATFAFGFMSTHRFESILAGLWLHLVVMGRAFSDELGFFVASAVLTLLVAAGGSTWAGRALASTPSGTARTMTTMAWAFLAMAWSLGALGGVASQFGGTYDNGLFFLSIALALLSAFFGHRAQHSMSRGIAIASTLLVGAVLVLNGWLDGTWEVWMSAG